MENRWGDRSGLGFWGMGEELGCDRFELGLFWGTASLPPSFLSGEGV